MKTVLTIALALAAGACDTPTDTPRTESPQASLSGRGAPASSNGGGLFTIGALDVRFAYTAIQTSAAGDAMGIARHSVDLGGQLVEFETEVTCLTVDAANGRAWIAGIITKNNSTHSSFTDAIHQPGQDIWFRVVDYGEGSGTLDRATFVGFRGSAGIITSREYCDTQPWPANDDRTNPVTQGNLQVRG